MRAAGRRLRRDWQAMAPGRRLAVAIVTTLLVMLVLLVVRDWLGGERRRLGRAMAHAEARYGFVRDTLAEVERLRAETSANPTSGRIQANVVVAVWRDLGLDLAVKSEGVDKFRIQGAADFDRLVQGLAILHRDQNLRVLSMAASRDGGIIRVEAVLGVGSP
jgi:type II secretory pathway component PulM